MGSMHSLKFDSDVSRIERFIALSRSISKMAAKEGLTIVPFHDAKLRHYSVLPDMEQKHVLDQLETLAFICEQLQQQGERVTSVKTLTWAFLKHFQCTAPSDLLTHMQDGDVVDAYGTSNKMLFAGLTFFQIFSYSLEEFFCQQWVELFERTDATVQAQLFQLSREMLEGQHSKVVSTKYIPAHEARERLSPNKITVRVEPQFFAPLYSKGYIIGYICSNRGSIIG